MSGLGALAVAVLALGGGAFWLVVLRPVLRSPAFAQRYHRDRAGLLAAVRGFRTMLLAWFVSFAAVLVELYDWLAPMIGGADWTPITSDVPGWVWPLVGVGLAMLFRWLRKVADAPEPATAPVIGGDQ